MLQGKKILIGVSGSIAAYKIANLIRLLKKHQAEVRVVMTASACDFIGPLTLATLSKNPVEIDFYQSSNGEWTNHVELGLWADLFLVAPATANTLAKMANGICDNLLIATYLSARCPVWFAPAMDLDMYQHPSTQKNIASLVSFGNRLIEPTSGELASGLVGKGRMEEPEELFELISTFFASNKPLKGKKVLVTAGPTYEALDPVRFIGNHSSGKMGIQIADVFAELGADVVLVCGPSHIQHNQTSIQRINIQSAQQMYLSAVEHLDYDIAIMAAAVADYTPSVVSEQKMKKKDGDLSISVERTKDILNHFGAQKQKGQILVGFAMETENEEANALDKAKRKNADFIVLNSINEKGAGFKGDTNKVKFVHNNGKIESFELKSKTDVAKDIAQEVQKILQNV